MRGGKVSVGDFKGLLAGLGGIMAAFGVISSILYFLGMELSVLMWLTEMDEGPQWGIRIGMIVVGVILALVFRATDDEDEDDD